MRFFALLLFVALIIAVADARGNAKTTRRPRPTPASNCIGKPSRQVCVGRRDEGSSGISCSRNANNNMWYYHQASRQCVDMRYLGCGGSGNRYCSRGDCENKCRR